jgi:glycosyltransferase involved in cell wall biosynthesis
MDHVRYLGTVPFRHLVALYRQAEFVISPGLYESSSLPVLEAAAAGTAVLASNIPPNQELAQTLRLNLFEPLDDQELAEGIFALWRDEGACRRQAGDNREQVARFTWENAARQYLSLIEGMGNPSPATPLREAAFLPQ